MFSMTHSIVDNESYICYIAYFFVPMRPIFLILNAIDVLWLDLPKYEYILYLKFNRI